MQNNNNNNDMKFVMTEKMNELTETRHKMIVIAVDGRTIERDCPKWSLSDHDGDPTVGSSEGII